MSVPTFTKTGTKATTAAKLNKAVFEAAVPNHDLLKQAYLTYTANGRTNNAKTLTRGNVRGGGKKPWKQKGTGRARFGSIRVPIWRGGGITFGPTGEENYTMKLSVKAKRTAIRQALTLKKEKVIILETFKCKDGKAASARLLLDKIGATGRTLVVVSEKDALVDRSTRNLQKVKAVQAQYLNVYDVLNADSIIISKKSLEIIDAWLTATKEAK